MLRLFHANGKNTTTLLLWFLASTAFLMVTPNAHSLTTQMYISPPSTTAPVGSSFVIDVNVRDIVNLAKYEVNITFNPSLMQVDFAHAGTFMDPDKSQVHIAWWDNTNGWICFGGRTWEDPLPSGSGNLFYINFNCTGAGVSSLHFAESYLWSDWDGTIPIAHESVDGSVTQTVEPWYFKQGYVDYAPSGVPDFDQRQDAWLNSQGAWTYCGPVAVSNSLWWMDSRFEPKAVPPPTVSDGYQLLTAYGPWDDHDPNNVMPFVNDLAWLMDTDGKRTGIPHNGTYVSDMQAGINQYLWLHGLYGLYSEQTIHMPTFEFVATEVERCEDVTLLLGFWQEQGPGYWVRVGGHYVTVVGVNRANNMIALSDPIRDAFEAGLTPGRSPIPHPPPPPHTSATHNNASLVSHDYYPIGQSPSPGNPAFGIYDYNTTWQNFVGQNFPFYEQGEYIPFLPVSVEVEDAVTVSPYPWYFKGWPEGYADYAPNGMPDFDQRQDGTGAYAPWNWTNPYPPVGQPSFCGPVAVANSLWWLDSQFEPNPVAPPTINDNFALVQSYMPGVWDDHDPQNVPYLVEDLAWLMDTNGLRSGTMSCGTEVHAMENGIEEYLTLKGMDWKFYEHTVQKPTYELIAEEVMKSQDVTLLLGFWQTADGGQTWWRTGGHYVTVAGVDPSRMKIAFSDPIDNAAEWPPGVVPGATGEGHVAPPPNPHMGNPMHDFTLHNDASYVSHDIYTVLPYSDSPGGIISLYDYWFADEYGNLFGSCQNFPDELRMYEGSYDPLLPVHTEIEYAVIVSCETGIVAAGSEDTNLYVWDFYGALQWQWALANPVVSVAMDCNGRYVAAGTRSPFDPVTGNLWLFDTSLGAPPGNVLWAKTLNVSRSYDGGWMGTESKSVDVKYNSYNGFVVVAAATDQGLYLYDQAGSLIWHYSDGHPETIVRISQDGNYIICGDETYTGTGMWHYFSHLADGVPGWQSTDMTPTRDSWDVHTFWLAISGDGHYIAFYAQTFGPNTMVLMDMHTGLVVWQYTLPKPQFWRIDMPCNGRSIVAVNDDPTDLFGPELIYWDDGGNGWDSGDSTPVWTYWPGKESGGGQINTHDFYTVAISENGDYISTGGVPSNTYLLTKAGAVQQIVAATPGSAVQSIDLTFTGKYGASGDWAGAVWFFNKDTGLVWSAATSGAPIHSMAISKIYPCMFPYPNHDLAVTSVVPDKTSVTPGTIVNIDVKVRNEGGYVESFFDVFVECLLDGVPQSGVNPDPATVASLASGTSTTVSFAWDTTGLPDGNYTVLAKVEITQDEIDVYDNNCLDGVVEIKTSTTGADIAVTYLGVCYEQTIVTQNRTHDINVTVTNQGLTSETFTLTVYWNTTNVIGSTSVSLLIGETKTITFAWTANQTRYRNYALSAYATPVTGETDTSDNTYVGDTVKIVWPGDVDGDKTVTILDVVKITGIYSAKYPELSYKANSDIDCDGKITILDVVLCTGNYGHSEP